MRYKTSTGMWTLAKREILRFCVVGQQTILPPWITSLLFMFIFGLSVGRHVELSLDNLSYLAFIAPGLITLHLISGSFENTSSSLFISRWHNHIQEILLSPLSYLEMVLGLLAGGMARGFIVATGVYAVANCFELLPLAHPVWLFYFMIMISIIFSCAGMLAALWADDFGMLTIWNIYVITPLVYLGGVFNPIKILPEALQGIAVWNPMLYLVAGMRYSILGTIEVPLVTCTLIAGALAVLFFAFTVHLFRIGYKLRQ